MLRGHSSHYVLENLLHDFDELGSNWGMARSSGYGRQPLLVPQFSSLTFSRSTAAVESTIRDCAQALGGQEEFASLYRSKVIARIRGWRQHTNAGSADPTGHGDPKGLSSPRAGPYVSGERVDF